MILWKLLRFPHFVPYFSSLFVTCAQLLPFPVESFHYFGLMRPLDASVGFRHIHAVSDCPVMRGTDGAVLSLILALIATGKLDVQERNLNRTRPGIPAFTGDKCMLHGSIIAKHEECEENICNIFGA